LLVGGGGREHALGWALCRGHAGLELLSAPGNPGLASLGRLLPIAATDVSGLAEAARRERVDLVVAGPEAPLVAGLADRLAHSGVPCFGPLSGAAALEGSKVFAKELLQRVGAPTARHVVARDRADVERAWRSFGGRAVVKVDGLAAGKGVLVAESAEAALAFAARALSGEAFGEAGKVLVVEERLAGRELTLFYWTNGREFSLLPAARDYKRLADGDRGPNTGGMGATAPHALPPPLGDAVAERVVAPVLAALRQRGAPYRGVLYCGIMVTAEGPMVLEFNCRFGDPEAQALLPLAGGDLAASLLAVAREERLPAWAERPGFAASVVLAAPGYPEAPRTGAPIEGVARAEGVEGALVFHAGTRLAGGRLVSAGGRVLAVTGTAAEPREARARAYRALSCLSLAGGQYRTDVGAEWEAPAPGESESAPSGAREGSP
jgi:phosphoribosylamine--glycine ligase